MKNQNHETHIFVLFQIVSEASSVETPLITTKSKISYGLFAGTVESYALASAAYTDIYLTCAYGDNMCFYSCQGTPEQRKAEMEKIIKGESLTNCVFRSKRSVLNPPKQLSITNTTDMQPIADESIENEFFSAALHLTTVIFLALTATFILISAIFSIVNVVFNPVEAILNVFGLYIWNGIASGLALITIILWISLFATSLTNNIAITDTLRQDARYTSDGLATIGVSFW